MKTIFLSVIIIFAAFLNVLKAQPVLSKTEKYDLGTTNNYFVIDTATISIGAAGANVLWDLSQVTPSAQTYSQQYLAPSQTQLADSFTTSTMVKKGNDGTNYFVKEANDSVWLQGILLDFTNILMQFSKPQLSMARPVHYNDSYSGTTYYSYSYSGAKYSGGGVYSYTVDGYGELKLQSGTYPNVLRVKYESDFYDTLVSNPTYISMTKTVAYYWYNPYNPSPLVQTFTTVVSSPGFTNTRKDMYVLKNPSTSARQAVLQDKTISAWVSGNVLYVKRQEETDGEMVNVFDTGGRLIANGKLAYTNNVCQAELSKNLAAGVYIVQVDGKKGIETVKISIF